MAEPITNGTSAPLVPRYDPLLTQEVRDLNLSELLIERGTSGLRRSGGFVREEALPDLLGQRAIKVYREMRDNSSVIGACLYAIETLVRHVQWHMEPADDTPEAQHYADLASGMVFQDLNMPWDLLISEILSCLPFGFSYFEMVYKRRLGRHPPPNPDGTPALPSQYDDALIGLGKIAPRSQDTVLRWSFSPNGDLLGMHQLDTFTGKQAFLPMEKCLLFRPTSYKDSPEGRSILRTAYRCFSADTELLTERGWTNVADIRMDDQLATLRPDGVMEYHAPVAVYAYAYHGDMLHITSRCLDQLVTPNHRLYVKPEYLGAPYRLQEAQTVSQRSCFKRDATWRAPDVSFYKIPAWLDGNGHLWSPQEVTMDAWVVFLAWFLAEGHTYRSKRGQRYVSIKQKKGPKADRIRLAIRALGFSCYEHPDGDRIAFEITRGQLYELLKPLGKSAEKYVPAYVKSLSARQIRLFLDTYLLGDGTPEYVGADFRLPPRLYTVSERMADDLMELAIKAGYVTNRRWQKGSGWGEGTYQVYLGTPNKHGYLGTTYDRVSYEGSVYCVTVPNHTVLARRNGKACWSGNSWYMVTHIENTEAVGIERDLTGLPLIGTPPQWWSATASPEDQAQLEMVKRIGRNVRQDEQACVVYPLIYDQSGNQLFRFELATSGGTKAIDTDKIVQRYELRITQSVLCDLLFLGHEDVGSFALASSKSTTLSTSLGGYLTAIKDEFNRRCLPKLWELNAFPDNYLPQLVHGDVESIDLTELARFMLSYGRIFNMQDLENHIRAMAGLPERPDAAENPLPPSIQPVTAQTPPGKQAHSMGGAGGGAHQPGGLGTGIPASGAPDIDHLLEPPRN